MKTWIYSVYFRDDYHYMFEAMRRSIVKNWPGAVIEGVCVGQPAEHRWLPRESADNRYKLDWWADRIQRAEDGDRIILADCDLLILQPLEAAFEGDFDVAYTVRDHHASINAGVVYVNINERSKVFVREWADGDRALYAKGAASFSAITRAAGLNQASLAKTIHRSAGWTVPTKLKQLPCRVWNCEQTSYAMFGDDTRVLHVKGWLREALLHDAPTAHVDEASKRLIPLCRSYGY